ncbi:hypothetical protein [Phormidesmis priestleyi]
MAQSCLRALASGGLPDYSTGFASLGGRHGDFTDSRFGDRGTPENDCSSMEQR